MAKMVKTKSVARKSALKEKITKKGCRYKYGVMSDKKPPRR